MERLVKDTNKKLKEIIKELKAIKSDYESKIKENKVQMDEELKKVREYKEEFIASKEKIDKMKADIEGFEADYQNLVDRFKNDELANILITANKEISAKIDERKRKIMSDKAAMNEIVQKAEAVKKNLVSLTGERKILESEYQKVTEVYNFYNDNLTAVITYANNNANDLSNKVAITIAKEEVAPDVIDIYVDRNNSNSSSNIENIDLDKVFSSSLISDIVDNKTETNAHTNKSKKGKKQEEIKEEVPKEYPDDEVIEIKDDEEKN